MSTNTGRYYLHADLDAFYPAVEQLDNPALRARPVLVLQRKKGRLGPVASASYEARAFGVTSQMSVEAAEELCPEVVALLPRKKRYRDIFRRVIGLLASITPLVEPVGLDEVYLDVSDQMAAAEPDRLARQARELVSQRVGLAVTVGGAASRVAAKVACKVSKPDGLLVVPAGGEGDFLAPLPVALLPGVGRRTASLLEQDRITTIGQLADSDEAWLGKALRERGPLLKLWASGQDTGLFAPHGRRQSVVAQASIPGFDVESRDVSGAVAALAEAVARSLRRDRLLCSSVSLELSRGGGARYATSASLPGLTSSEAAISRAARELADGLECGSRTGRSETHRHWYARVGVSGLVSAEAL